MITIIINELFTNISKIIFKKKDRSIYNIYNFLSIPVNLNFILYLKICLKFFSKLLSIKLYLILIFFNSLLNFFHNLHLFSIF